MPVLSNQQSKTKKTFLFTYVKSSKHVKNILTYMYYVWHDTWILNFYTGVKINIWYLFQYQGKKRKEKKVLATQKGYCFSVLFLLINNLHRKKRSVDLCFFYFQYCRMGTLYLTSNSKPVRCSNCIKK